MSNAPELPNLQALLDEIAREAPFASIASLNARLAHRVQQYNTTPQPELGGLSPDQMAQLLYGDWTSVGAFRVVGSAPPTLLLEVPIVADARTIMAYVEANAPVKLTPKGNLTRAAVAALAPQLRTMARKEDLTSIVDARIRNEDDVRWLPIVRHLLLFARLLTKRKGLLLSARGRGLLPEVQAGALFVELFCTFFRQFNLQYLYGGQAHPGLQHTIAYSFYQLSHLTREWTDSTQLAEQAWLASARDPMSAWEREHTDMRPYAFRYRVLEPLVHFGLLERRELPGDDPWRKRVEFRQTALYGQVLQCPFTAPAPR
jgi:hypothetical protein